MFARIGTWQGSPADLERWIVRGREQVKPAIRQDPGLTAVYWLVDRGAGKGMIVTLWESREAMAASEQARAAPGRHVDRDRRRGDHRPLRGRGLAHDVTELVGLPSVMPQKEVLPSDGGDASEWCYPRATS
jgi:heme-degrading monooxygenase HmoA